jgi:branched-chain amino acid transport system permease protein
MPWAGIGYGSGTHVYFTVLVWVLAGIALLYAYNLTLFGRLTIGLRESERRLSFLGYNTNATKVVVFAVSAMFSGLAGGLLVFANESINYSSLSMGASSAVILHTFVGGSSMFLGPVLGAGLFTLLGSVVTDLTKNWLLYQGLLFILIMMFMGDGLSMLISRVTSEVRQRNWAGLLHRLQLLVGGMTGVTGFVLGMELITRVLDRQYQGAKAMSEQWPAIALAGIDWQPDQALTWVVPAALMLAGSAIIGWVIWRNRQRHPLAALQQEAAR